MIRKKLGHESGQRKKFQATFERLGRKTNFKGYSEDTILLKNIIDCETNEVVSDHLWFSFTKGFEKLNLISGIVLEFEARVKSYSKGYVNKKYKINKKEMDFKLSHPTKINKITPSNP